MADLTRRGFLSKGMVLGCSAAAAPMMTPITLAAAPWDTRLVVIILRGAMDGLDVVRPVGDPAFAGLRRNLPGGAIDLDGFYALHPALSDLIPLWRRGQLSFAQAVSTPYRNKRSHFDGQDLLEAGTGFDIGAEAAREGWLNRMLQAVPGVTAETAFAIGQGEMRVLTGPAPASNWSPDTRLALTPATEALMARLMAPDPLFRAAFDAATSISADAGNQDPTIRGTHRKVAEFAAGRLLDETRIAAFSINGWDTHAKQANTIQRPLAMLSDTILTLQARLGPVWDRTAVLAMTEFGRTARENGTRGTDHGTGSALVMAGGAIRGGRVYGDWPGLAEADLYDRRDLMPTADVRAYAALAMQGLFGLDRDVLESAVFPGLRIGDTAQFML